ncbi:MAG: arginase family protein [Nanoarchaeota archaeon]|nr:arginase family protein [Nanoarchaeota archaeon]MBU1321468.1 arginase family protein [Nanoarchaeota archaeon]MBU1597402.1 arginase family protein [Nanoarchaeota archaeon]MBU2442369.1 arginase family protein [Nanoarchaeota archaeon]
MRIFKIPLNAGAMSKKQGIEKGPDKIAGFLKDFHLTENNYLPVFDVKEIKVDNSNLSEAHKMIEQAVEKIDFPTVLIGGDHSMTYPAFKAFAKNNPKAGIIVFDAHPDVQEKHNPPTHEDYLRVLIEEGIVDKNNVILVGTRNMSIQEKKFIDDNKLKVHSMRKISFDILREVADTIMSVARLWSKVYISVDIDVLDPGFAPGTGYCEPGGLTTRQLIYIIHRLKMLRNIGMVDVVEVNPDKDVNDITSKTAAKLVVELS